MPDALVYNHDVKKLPDAGLNLNLPPDLVSQGQYSRFTNALSRIEGQVQTRDGLELVCNVGGSGLPVHTIFRLNQVIPTVNGERLFGISSELWTAPLPAGNVPTQLTEYIVADVSYPAFPVTFDGTPLSIIPFRFDADPQAWAIFANGAKMMKRKEKYYEQLGLPAPIEVIHVTVDGAGNLVGDYAWRYTYVNEVTNTESNPSPEMLTASLETLSPVAFTTPDPDIGGSPASLPTNTSGDMSAGGFVGNSLASMRWPAWATPSQPYKALSLKVSSAILMAPRPVAFSTATIEYSTDGGATWNSVFTVTVGPGGSYARGLGPGNAAVDTVALLATQDLSLLQVRAYVSTTDATPGVLASGLSITDLETVGTLEGSELDPVTFSSQSADLCVLPPTDPQETAIRLYRFGGTLTDNYYFVGQYPVSSLTQGGCGVGFLEITDNAPDVQIEANPTLELDNDMPVSSVQVMNQTLKAIWGFDERVLGVGDPARPEAIYFSKRGNADAWPPENWIVTSEPGTEMMNGLSWALRCFAFSRERLYTLVLNVIQGVTFTPQETSCRRGLKGRFGFCVGEKGIYFVSKDGIYLTAGAEEVSVVDDSIRPLFPTFDDPIGVDTNGYEAIDMSDENGLRLSRHNSEIWFDYTGATSGDRQTLIYDERRNRWRGYFSAGGLVTSSAQMHYSEPETVSRLLTGHVGGKVLQSTNGVADESDVISVQIRTGAFDQGVPLNLKEYGNVIFDIDPGGADVANPVTITPYINGDQVPQAAITVTGTGRQRVALDLSDTYGLNMSFEITWTTVSSHAPIVYQLDILYRVEPAAMKHWEVPVNSLGMQGWFHVRDSYVVLRSAADVTMEFIMDNGSTQSFTLTSTAGVKKKLYVPFLANKIKLAGFTFDSTSDFRIYQPECELRAKQWITQLGYQVVPLFGAENA